MAVAGLWEGWQKPDRTWLRSYSVITCAAAGRQALLHPRMPVVLPPEDWPAWLGEISSEPDAIQRLPRPVEDGLLAFWPVGARIGRVAENDAGLSGGHDGALPEKWSVLNDPPPDWAKMSV